MGCHSLNRNGKKEQNICLNEVDEDKNHNRKLMRIAIAWYKIVIHVYRLLCHVFIFSLIFGFSLRLDAASKVHKNEFNIQMIL